MSLKEIFEKEYKSKTREVVNEYKKKINQATPEAREKAIRLYIAEQYSYS